MKPRTKLEKRVTGLSSKLSTVTEVQKEWAKEHIFTHEAYRCKDELWCSECFKYSFEKYIKDCVGDELADACIRLFDLCGLRKIDINDFTEEMIYEATESCNGETFTESIYAISTIPVRYEYEYGYSFEKQVKSMLLGIIGFANYTGIDLLWHINQKMRYNELRENKHGKRY